MIIFSNQLYVIRVSLMRPRIFADKKKEKKELRQKIETVGPKRRLI